MLGYCSIVKPCEYCLKFYRDILVRTTLNLCAINDSSSCNEIQWKEEKDLRFWIRNVWLKQKQRFGDFCAFVDSRKHAWGY